MKSYYKKNNQPIGKDQVDVDVNFSTLTLTFDDGNEYEVELNDILRRQLAEPHMREMHNCEDE